MERGFHFPPIANKEGMSSSEDGNNNNTPHEEFLVKDFSLAPPISETVAYAAGVSPYFSSRTTNEHTVHTDSANEFFLGLIKGEISSKAGCRMRARHIADEYVTLTLLDLTGWEMPAWHAFLRSLSLSRYAN